MSTGRPSRWTLRALDGLQYGLGVTLTASVAAALLAYLLALAAGGVDALGSVNPVISIQLVLFFGGFAAMAFGALKLRPEAPYKENSRLSLSLPDSGTGEAGGFAEQVTGLPPRGWYETTDDDRLSDGGRLLVASGLMLLGSFLVEIAALARL